jgi:carbamoyl-phosphate synthase large subunit
MSIPAADADKSSLPTVAITGVNARPDNPGPGLAVARCLRESGRCGRIVALGYDALDPGLFLTEYCDAGYLIPYPSSGEKTYRKRLAHVLEEESIDVLIPCLDAELVMMERLRPWLTEHGVHMVLPSAEQIAMRNKDRLTELSELAGLQCPRIKTLTHAAFFDRCEEDGWRYPLVVKGLYYGARIVSNAREGIAAFHAIAAEWGYPVLVQHFVRGEEVNLAALGDGKGGLYGPVMMKKRALTDKGKAWAGVSIDDPRLLKASKSLVNALKWIGPLEVEAMRDAEGELHLIEINPRFPAWIYLSAHAGTNLPAALVDHALGIAPPPAPEPRPGIFFIRYPLEHIVPLSDYESVVMHGRRN